MEMQLVDSKSSLELKKIYSHHLAEISKKVDRIFAPLMGVQWVVAVLIAWFVSDLGEANLLLASAIGGLLSLPSILCAWMIPGEKVTRYVNGAGQIFFSILFTYLTADRAQAHLHIFMSLALLAFYLDIKLLGMAATLVIAAQLLWALVVPKAGGAELGFWLALETLILSAGILKICQALLEMAGSKVELLQAKEELTHKSALKSAFISNMSHEIRTPMGIIIGFTDILKESELDDEQKQYVSTIHRCSESLLVLLNDILDFSKIESGLLNIDRHRFNLRELHHELQSMFAMRCKDKGLNLEFHLDAEIPHQNVGDSHRIKQILVNIVGNAVKFTDQGQVTVHVAKDVANDGLYQWKIQDTGIGIAPEYQNKIFSNYSQEHPSISRKYGGSGLGLLISKNLVELMGGNISVESRQGEGTTFLFTLKLEDL